MSEREAVLVGYELRVHGSSLEWEQHVVRRYGRGPRQTGGPKSARQQAEEHARWLLDSPQLVGLVRNVTIDGEPAQPSADR